MGSILCVKWEFRYFSVSYYIVIWPSIIGYILFAVVIYSLVLIVSEIVLCHAWLDCVCL